jgi:hydrogenase/urease accessory protein HupE
MHRALLLCLLLSPLAAGAHQASVSFSELEVHDAKVDGTLRFALADLRPQIDVQPLNAAALSRLLLESFVVKSSGLVCALQPGAQAALDGDDGVALTAHWQCPRLVEELSVRVGFLDTFPTGAVHLSRIRFGPDEISQRVAQAEEPSFEARYVHSARSEVLRFVRLGLVHIFTGYDHLAFLLGLLLLGGSVRRLAGVVSAFAVAHSITLALAVLGLVVPSPPTASAMIAGSVIFVGLEDLWALRKDRTEAALRRRWAIAFVFGLVHGFGFGAALRELQLPRALLAAGLVSFNLGLEAGQVCVVLLMQPVLYKLRAYKNFAPGAALCVAALGAFWLSRSLLGM